MTNLLEIVDIVGKAADKYDGKKLYVSTGALAEDTIDESKCEYYIYNEKPSRANLQVLEGDIIFAKMQGTKKTLIIDKNNMQNLFSTGFCAIKPKKNKITTKCLYYLISSEFFLKNKDKNCSGATQKAITYEGLSKIYIKLPQLEEQEKICKFLDKIVDINRKYRKQIELLDTLIKARFVEMFGDIDDKKKWECKRWDEVVEIKNGKDYKKVLVKEGGYPVYGTGGEMARASEYICPENTIIVGRKGSINNPLLIKEKFWNVDTAFGVIAKENINYQYLYQFCKSFNFMKLNKATTLPSTTKEDLLKIEINLPPIELQDQFATFVQHIDKLKFGVKKSLEKTQMLFDSLMQEFF